MRANLDQVMSNRATARRASYDTLVFSSKYANSTNLGDLYEESGQTLQGSFSAVSQPNFASKYSLESSRRELHNALLYTAPQCQFLFEKLPNVLLICFCFLGGAQAVEEALRKDR